MDLNTLWSLRLGFSGSQSGQISKIGIEEFLSRSFAAGSSTDMPSFLEGLPKTPAEVAAVNKENKAEENRKVLRLQQARTALALRGWWIDGMKTQYPLREKMTLFWHNHFVATTADVKIARWIYDHNSVMRDNAFGNVRDLTRKALYTNALIMYLNNNRNRKGNYNENLSRELLELFTLGIGNYTEIDIRNGARALAGLTRGDNGGVYLPQLMHGAPVTYFGRKGIFTADDMVDIIFDQRAAPYFITRKILQWFIYDSPPEALVQHYGDFLRQSDYEIKPLLLKLVTEEFSKPTAGSKIKDPLVFIMQLLDELGIDNQNSKVTATFTAAQGMDLFNQPNVKGWTGGRTWLTAQRFLQRNRAADALCKGRNMERRLPKELATPEDVTPDSFHPKVKWEKGNNKEVIAQLRDRLLFAFDETLQKDFEAILKYDFDPQLPGAENGVLRLFNYMVKTPEFQII